MKSVFLTGASGVGKSTAFRGIVEHGLAPLPNHLTRPPRPSEIEGFDAHFISVSEFSGNMATGAYLESSMTEAEYGGVYYGSPVAWEKNEQSFVAIPSNTDVLSDLLRRLNDRGQRDSIVWANLHAPLDIRHKRVAEYISDPNQLQHRLYSGVTQGIKPDADINIDTGIFLPHMVIEKIVELAKYS